MSLRPLARFGLLAILIAAPFAAAQSVPEVPTDPLGQPPAEVPDLPPPPGTVLDIDEHGLTFRGDVANPEFISLMAPDGMTALAYELDEQGRVRLDVAGENAIADATLVAIEGNPLGDSFTIAIVDAQGGRHDVLVDLAAQIENLDLPPELQVPPIVIDRPFDWPGAPERSYILFAEDSNKNRLGLSQLDGSSFLQKGGTHRFVLQIPNAENAWDRWSLAAHLAARDESVRATFEPIHSTDTATMYAAEFAAGLLGAKEGDTLAVDVLYEQRLTPFVVNRFEDPLFASYLVDGKGPTVAIDAPLTSDSFKFEVSWSGVDELSGIGGFTVDYRAQGATLWNRWLDKAPDTSALFSGDWGKSYQFRVRSLDEVGNPSEFAMAAVTVDAKPSDDADVNDPPTARITSPKAGAVLAGSTFITWEAADPDGTPVTSKLELSDDDGLSWRILYTGQQKRVPWDTGIDLDGSSYRLRLTVSDGSLSAADAVSGLTVRNIVAPPAPPEAQGSEDPVTPSAAPPVQPSRTQQGGAGTDEESDAPTPEAEEKAGIPMPFVGVAIGIAALLAARRRQA